MKKVLSILLVAVMIFSLTACNNKQPVKPPPADSVVTEPEDLPVDESQPTEEIPDNTESVSKPTEDPEENVNLTVGEIMATALKHLSEEEYVAGTLTLFGGDETGFKIHTTTGEYYGYYITEGSKVVYTDEYYVVKEADKYASYKVDKEDDFQGNRVKWEASKYIGYQEIDVDLSPLYWIEAYLTLVPETTMINDIECYALKTSDTLPDISSMGEFTVYVDCNTGKLVRMSEQDEDEIVNADFSYEPFTIVLPESVSETAILKDKTYDDEYKKFFPLSAYNHNNEKLYNISIDDIDIQIGEKPNFLNLQNEQFFIEDIDTYLIDSLHTEKTVEITQGIVPPQVLVTYKLKYYTDNSVYYWSVVTQNMTETPIKESECSIVAIFQNGEKINESDLLLSDIKAIYGNQYERFIGDETLVLVWSQEEYAVMVAVYEDAIESLVIMHNSMFNVFKALMLQPVDQIKEPLKRMPLNSAATFTVDSKEYKLCDSTNEEFAPYLGEIDEFSVLTKSKMYTAIYGSLTAPLSIFTTGSNNDSKICGYGLTVIDGANNNFKMSNGLSLTSTYDDFVLVFGNPTSTLQEDDELITWSDNRSLFTIKAAFDKDGKVVDIIVMDMTPYTLDIMLSVAGNIFSEKWSEIFDVMKEPNN
ncbi:MAG: hypothetical protein IJ419_11315 [Agathobacter sp.]|nr:hypothetical protein [Agathobacter sp.]